MRALNKFFSFIIRQSVAIALVVIFALAFGVYSTLQMPINLLPDINVPMVCVQAIYAGANAQSVEADLTEKLEEGLSAISGVTAVDSYSYDNLSAVVLSFDYGTDTKEKQTEINGKLTSLDLPKGVSTEVYDIDLNAEALAVLSVTSSAEGDLSLENAYAAAGELAAKISAIDGVENVEIKGGARKIWSVRPFAGLELTAPLFVKAFSYGALDIPLGNLHSANGEVQIRNNSDITAEADIKNMPLTLPASIAALLSGVKRIADYYGGSTAEDLITLRTDLAEGVAVVLAELDDMSAEELENLAELKTYMNIASAYTADELKNIRASRYYSEILKRVEGKTDDELQDIADEVNAQYSVLPFEFSADLLKVVRDGKIDLIIGYREELESTEEYKSAEGYYEPTDEDYVELALKTGLYPEDAPREEILPKVQFVRQTSASGLSSIARQKREAENRGESYSPTDAECALLFTGTTLSDEHPVIMSPMFMAFVRADSYENNMQILIDNREKFGDDVDAAEYYKLYSETDLTGIMDLTLSEQLIDFILKTDFSNISDGGLVVRTEEIATVAQEEEYDSYVYFGDPQTPRIIKGTTIEVYKSNGANASAVVEAVKEAYGDYLKTSGAASFGARVELLDDQSQFISESISNVLVSMLIGGLLAVLVIFVFLKKIKTSLIIAVTMPLSVLASMICLYAMGITLNMVSLGGLAVGIGMLVDNSIVVIESISKHRDMDKTAYRAAVDGTTEVGGALFGSTVTTVCVFIPILFSGGLTGEIFTDLSWAVIFSLTLSLVVAVTVIPALYAMLCNDRRMLKGGRLKKEVEKAANAAAAEVNVEAEVCHADSKTGDVPAKKTFRQRLSALKEPKLMNGIINFYGRLLPKVLKRKAVPILTAVAIFGASIGLLFLTGTEFLPSIDKGQIEVTMSYDSGESLEAIQTDVSAFARLIEEEFKDNLDYISVSVGKNGLLALTDTGIITIQLNTNRGTDGAVNAVRRLSENDNSALAGRRVSVKQIDGVVASLMSGSDDLSVTVLGEDGETLKKIAAEIVSELEKPENGFKDVKSTATDKALQTDVKFDRRALADRGLDYETLVLTLRIGISSYTACTATVDGADCSVNVAFDKESLTDASALKDFAVGFDGNGKAIKLSDVAEVSEPYEVDACIRHSGGRQMISVSAALPNVDTGTAGKLMKNIAADVLQKYEGYSFQQSGISSYLNDAFAGLAVALVISFFLLFAVMAVQFGSAVKALIIMASIPFSFTGGFVALVITGTSLNVVSFIGLIMLMGVVVNNAIVMLEKIKQLHDEGMPHFTAVQEACKVRLRPIFMTTLTTILALIPLAVGVGQGSELMQPLGIVVIGGLLIGTLVTLVLIPAVYCAVHRLSEKFPDGKKKGAEG